MSPFTLKDEARSRKLPVRRTATLLILSALVTLSFSALLVIGSPIQLHSERVRRLSADLPSSSSSSSSPSSLPLSSTSSSSGSISPQVALYPPLSESLASSSSATSSGTGSESNTKSSWSSALQKRGASSSSSSSLPSLSTEQLSALVRRLLPVAYHSHFIFSINSSLTPVSGASTTNVYDIFHLSNSQDKVQIEAMTLSGLGAGLNYYLREVCWVEMSWSGDRFTKNGNDLGGGGGQGGAKVLMTEGLPLVPPLIPTEMGEGRVVRGSFVPWRYYMNVVTFGYSFVFWDWERWERELDWMMLNGVNMALAMVGQEYVVRQFYENLGLSREEINGFLGGPAFMPWQRMGNTQGSWGFENDTKFKNDWIDSQWALQQQIMERMNGFNITAIMPAFNGFVPQEMITKFPNTTFEHSSNWAQMPDEYTKVTFVPSTDPLFTTLSQQFIQLQNVLYASASGSGDSDTAPTAPSHHYLLDLYNELNPTCTRVDCLESITAGVMKALKAADPEAVWVLQGWFLLHRDIWQPAQTKAFFDGIRQVNQGRDAFVIDLYSDVAPLWESSEGFFGIDWGWSMLNNFGGGQGLYGTLPTLITEPFRGYRHPTKSMRGMGITMEGINNNEYLYQLILDLPWESAETSSLQGAPTLVPPSTASIPPPITGLALPPTPHQEPFNPQSHLQEFIRRRYGPQQTTDAMIQAWTTLSQTVWDCRTGQMSQSKTFLDTTPALEMKRPGFMGTEMWYDQAKVVGAWGVLVQSTETEESKKRRGRGGSSVQNAVEGVLMAAAGKPLPVGSAGIVEGSVKGRTKKTTTTSQWIRDAIWNTAGQSFPHRATASSTSASASSGQGQRLQQKPLPSKRSTNHLLLHPRADPAPSPSLPPAFSLPLNVSSFRYDLVDVTREVLLAVVLPGFHRELVQAYKEKDLEKTRSTGRLILDLIRDTDRVLATHSHFMVGPWIRDARESAKMVGSSSLASASSSRNNNASITNTTTTTTTASTAAAAVSVQAKSFADYLEFNARNQITWWGPAGQQGLADYASKHWAGLVLDFYLPRWQIFVDRLVSAVQKRKPLDYSAYRQDSLKVETQWQMASTCPDESSDGCVVQEGQEAAEDGGSGGSSGGWGTRTQYEVEPVEDTVRVVQELWDKWQQAAARFGRQSSTH